MHPEHHDLSTAVYLPVTDETCASLLQPDGAKTLGELTDAQLAAVLGEEDAALKGLMEKMGSAFRPVLALDGKNGGWVKV